MKSPYVCAAGPPLAMLVLDWLG